MVLLHMAGSLAKGPSFLPSLRVEEPLNSLDIKVLFTNRNKGMEQRMSPVCLVVVLQVPQGSNDGPSCLCGWEPMWSYLVT